ncbi:MAG: GEVED domain-containing protein, partial [Chitinophagales bacterium]
LIMSGRLTLNLLFLLCSFMFANIIVGQQSSTIKPLARMVAEGKLHYAFEKMNVLTPYQPATERLNYTNAFATNITHASLETGALKSFFQEKKQAITFEIPYKENILELELVQVNILADNFKITTGNGEVVAYNPGVYYRGIVKDDPTSIVAISIFDNEIYGVVSTTMEGNINIGRYRGPGAAENDYVIFSDLDILVENSGSGCATPEPEGYEEMFQEIMQGNGGVRIEKCPKVYLEADYDLYLNKGTITATSNYLTSIFNNSATIYANEEVPIEISEIYVWTTNDGYSSASSYSALTDFKAARTTFNGDIAHLIALDPGGLGGVAATINGLCNTYKYCYSDVNSTYSDFPTYSWTIMVITHEMGHLFGSYHTHSCTWAGGAIDNCYTPEGGCASGPAPVGGGTIMSYCHLTVYGINFSNGFGTLPGNAIRNTITAAACVTSCAGAGPAYCYSAGANASEEWIESVNINGTSNTSGNNGGYVDFTAVNISLTPGTTASFTLTPGFAASTFPEYFSIWIDYNNDLDFNDADENVFNSGATTTLLTGSINIPTTASGTTRMRIAMKYNSSPTSACELFAYGEVEDYTVSFTPPAFDYCNAGGLNATNEWIDFFKLGSINRTSGSDGGYYDGTASTTSLMPGSSYTLKYSCGFSGTAVQEFYKAWIDYNRDGDFTDAGEEILIKKSKSTNTISSSFTVPTTAATGETRIRLAMKKGAYPSPCETFDFGEVEDYTVNILAGLTGAPAAFASALTVFPNPTNGFIVINSELLTGVKMHVSIVDLAGRTVYASTTENQYTSAAIDINHLSPGLYLVRIGDGEKWLSTTELIKE